MSRLGRLLPRRAEAIPSPAAGPDLDSWLPYLFGDVLDDLEGRCASGGADLAAFSGLDDELWALLLSREYTAYPAIRAALPELPDPELQRNWNGTSGLALIEQGRAFYGHVKRRFAEHGAVPLERATVLDYGCGWGRLTRFFGRDVEPGALLACDPVEEILEICRRSGVRAEIERSDFVPDRLPFDRPADLVYAFSVFTHLSEPAHEACLRAIHAAMNPGGILVVTVRPPAYLELDERLRATLDGDREDAMAGPRYLFAPHPAEESHPQYQGEEMTYGDTLITLEYVRERWTPSFELLETGVLVNDLHQTPLTLRRV